ncbi:MAG TPA: hypothetical protein VIV11_22525 [Kofleriaceae bacterium]
MRWIWRGVAGATLVLGWVFILWQNKFNMTVPVVVIGLGYLAVVATVANLWRVGASAVAPEDNSPEAWTKPLGARGELEKEKKTLLKAIKEAEFDLAMGKLSKADSDELIRMYRARAIEVIKAIDELDAGDVASPRQRIQREVQARLAVDKEKPKKDKKTARANADAKAAEPKLVAETKRVVDTQPVDTKPVDTDPVKTESIETDPVRTPADDNSPEDIAAAKATKNTEATS